MDAKCLHILRSKAILKNISISEQQQFSPTGYMLSCGARTLFYNKSKKLKTKSSTAFTKITIEVRR